MRILFLCTGNSARSLMAEAFTRAMLPAGAPVELFSAGTQPKGVHPETLAVMAEAGVDMSAARSKSISEVPFLQIDLVVTLCDEARASCPAPPPGARRLHWGLRDPAAAGGSPQEVREAFRAAREEVRICVKSLVYQLATLPHLRAPRAGGSPS